MIFGEKYFETYNTEQGHFNQFSFIKVSFFTWDSYAVKTIGVGLNNIHFEKLSDTNLQTEQSGFGRKLQACKDHLPTIGVGIMPYNIHICAIF